MFPVPEFISGIQIGPAPARGLSKITLPRFFFFAALLNRSPIDNESTVSQQKYSLFAFALAAPNGVLVVVLVVLLAVLSFSSNARNGLPALVSVL